VIKSIRITTQNEKAIKSVLSTEDAEFHLLNSTRKYLLLHEEAFGRTHQVIDEESRIQQYYTIRDEGDWTIIGKKSSPDEPNIVLERPMTIGWDSDDYAIVVSRANFKSIRNLRNDPDEKLIGFLGYILVVNSASPGREYGYYMPSDFERLYEFEGLLSDTSGWKPVRKKAFTHPSDITEEQVEQWIEAETIESFRPIPQFPGYEVNREGVVRNVNNRRTLATYVVVWKNGKSYRMATELLAHSAFKTEDQ